MDKFTIEEVITITQVVGFVQSGKSDSDRTLGYAMWRALQNRSSSEVRRTLLKYYWEVGGLRITSVRSN